MREIEKEYRGSEVDFSTGIGSDLISNVSIRLVDNGTDGLLAWASCWFSGAIKLDNIAIRRSRDGSLFLTYPARRKGQESHQYFHPISVGAAQAIQDAVLAQLAVLAKAAAQSEAHG